MTDGSADVSRRAFMRTAAGATAASAAAGTAAAQESGGNNTSDGGGGGGGGSAGPPDYGSWFSNVGNFDGETVDATGQDEVTVTVGAEGNGGAFAFDPPAVHVDNGATVKFEWTGNGGGHNVKSDGDGPLDSGSAVASSGVNYEHTFENDGIFKYVCVPHEGLGMKGAVVVGTDYPTSGGGGGGGGGDGGSPEVPGSAKTLGVATSFVMVATLGLAYFFMRYGGDYETPDVE
ncbi:halocyanin domain-containing protein [Halomicroarcula sp. F13]|uniref:Halocyanin domain-containing protein n=1 Tax=Haloarcula rubra TaxID=2487747 RepID=A0AAW4PN27_9EURY|nr:halocyanin domain-containing protein [Halomicroarcula rubra]MBX0321742.1 halocyanin domain-containing protein [Halomicroarcula rubra]